MHKSLSPVLIGALCLILSEALFAGVGACVKFLSDHLHQTQLVFFRNLLALLFLLPFMLKSPRQLLHSQRKRLHLFRAMCGLSAMYLFFRVLSHLPLAAAMMALLMAPFIVPVVARAWLNERVSAKTMVAMCIGFVGVLVILAPSQQGMNFYVLLAFCCAVLVAISKCTIRKLSDTEPSLRIVAYFTGISTLVSLFPMLGNWQPIDGNSWSILGLMGGLAATGQLLMTRSFKLASPVQIGLLTYSSVLFAALFGYLFWQEPVTPGLALGTLLLFIAANITIRQRWLW